MLHNNEVISIEEELLLYPGLQIRIFMMHNRTNDLKIGLINAGANIASVKFAGDKEVVVDNLLDFTRGIRPQLWQAHVCGVDGVMMSYGSGSGPAPPTTTHNGVIGIHNCILYQLNIKNELSCTARFKNQPQQMRLFHFNLNCAVPPVSVSGHTFHITCSHPPEKASIGMIKLLGDESLLAGLISTNPQEIHCDLATGAAWLAPVDQVPEVDNGLPGGDDENQDVAIVERDILGLGPDLRPHRAQLALPPPPPSNGSNNGHHGNGMPNKNEILADAIYFLQLRAPTPPPPPPPQPAPPPPQPLLPPPTQPSTSSSLSTTHLSLAAQLSTPIPACHHHCLPSSSTSSSLDPFAEMHRLPFPGSHNHHTMKPTNSPIISSTTISSSSRTQSSSNTSSSANHLAGGNSSKTLNGNSIDLSGAGEKIKMTAKLTFGTRKVELIFTTTESQVLQQSSAVANNGLPPGAGLGLGGGQQIPTMVKLRVQITTTGVCLMPVMTQSLNCVYKFDW